MAVILKGLYCLSYANGCIVCHEERTIVYYAEWHCIGCLMERVIVSTAIVVSIGKCLYCLSQREQTFVCHMERGALYVIRLY